LVFIIGKAAAGNGVGFNADSAGEVSNVTAKLLIHLANNFLPTTLALRYLFLGPAIAVFPVANRYK
jgi:hypothetical protein